MTTSSIRPPALDSGFGILGFRLPSPRRSRRLWPAPRPRHPRALQCPRSPPPRALPRPSPPPSRSRLPPSAPPEPPRPRAPRPPPQAPRSQPPAPLPRLLRGLDRRRHRHDLLLADAIGVDRGRLAVRSAGNRDYVVVDPPAPLGDAGGLADPAAQVVELRPAHVATRRDLEFLDLRRVQRERPLDADAEGLLAHGEGLAHARPLALEDNALEDLGPLASSLDDLEVDANTVTGLEVGQPLPKLGALDAVDYGAHLVCVAEEIAARKNRRDPGAGTARSRNGSYSAFFSNCSARSRLCPRRHSRTLPWSPESRTSGTSQPR